MTCANVSVDGDYPKLNFSGTVEIGRELQPSDFGVVQWLCQLALRTRGMVLIAGDLGNGKSVAVRRAVASAPASWRARYIRLAGNPTSRSTVQQLHSSYTGVRAEGSAYELGRILLKETARREASLLVIDEVGALMKPDVELLRELRDNQEENFGLVFVAGPEAFEKTSTWAPIWDRFVIYHHYGKVDAREAVHLLPAFHPIYEGCPTSILSRIHVETERGSLRSLAKLTFYLSLLMVMGATDTITEELIDKAVDMRGNGKFPGAVGRRKVRP